MGFLKKEALRGYIEILKAMFQGAVTSVRSIYAKTSEFPMVIGLHQGSGLSHYFFTLIMDELTTHIQEAVPSCRLFVDDIVSVDEFRDGVNIKLVK